MTFRTAPMVDGGGGQGADPDRDDDDVGGRPAGRVQAVVDLPEHGRVPLDDPARHLLVTGPARVRDDQAARAGFLRRTSDCVLISAGHYGHDRPLGGNGLDAGRRRPLRHEDTGVEAQQPGHAGHRFAVVPVRSRGQGERTQRAQAGRQFLDGLPRLQLLPGVFHDGPVRGPRSAEDLERHQPQPGSFTLDEDLAEAEPGRQPGRAQQRRGLVLGKATVELQGLSCVRRPHLGLAGHGVGYDRRCCRRRQSHGSHPAKASTVARTSPRG